MSQPSYLKGFARILRDAPLATWKSYFKWQLLDTYAPFLSPDFVSERISATPGKPANSVSTG